MLEARTAAANALHLVVMSSYSLFFKLFALALVAHTDTPSIQQPEIKLRMDSYLHHLPCRATPSSRHPGKV